MSRIPDNQTRESTRAGAGRVERAVRWWVRLLVARPWMAVALLTAATAGALVYGAGIEIRSDMEDLFPADSPSVVRAREARRIVGSRSEVQVIIGSPDRDTNRQVAAELAQAFAAHQGQVARVEFRRDVELFRKNALLFLSRDDLRRLDEEVTRAIADATRQEMESEFEFDFGDAPEAAAKPAEPPPERRHLPTEDELRERFDADDLREYVETPDGQVIAVKVYPSFPPSDAGRTATLNALLAQDIAAALARHPGRDLTVTTEGDYAHVTAVVQQIGREATRAFIVALVGVALMLLVYFRRLRALVVTMVSLVFATIWTYAFARLAIGYLNFVTAAIFSIVLGLGIDFVVHATARTDEARARGLPLREALPEALSSLFGAMLWAAVCATATFFSLVVFEFRGFSQFGLIAGVGGLLCFAGAYVFFPPLEAAIASLRSPRRPPATRAAPAAAEPAPAPAAREPGPRFGWTVLAIYAAILAVAATQLPHLTLEADMRALRLTTTRVTSELRSRYLHEAEQRSTSPLLVITDDLDETRRLDRHLRAMVPHEPLLESVMSIFTFVPDDQPEKLAQVREIKRKLDLKYGLLDAADRAEADRLLTWLDPHPFGVDDLPDWLVDKFTDTDGRLGRYVLMHVAGTKSVGRRVLEIQQALGTIVMDGKEFHPTASWMILGDAYGMVLAEGPWAIGLACLVVLLILALDLRSARDVLTVFVPLVAGFVAFIGAAVALGAELNIVNIVVLPTVFGMGVDTAIHLVHRINEGDSLRVVFRTTGRAAGVSVATDAVGFAALLFSSNEGLRSIGVLAVIGLLTIYITSVSLIAAFVAVGWKRPPSPSLALAATTGVIAP
ncbi:MAG: MMPL family transporter [Deltaproteobacteria bacterium]|nr:MMPL family transporter [Deltaproteobacteria bacterium]